MTANLGEPAGRAAVKMQLRRAAFAYHLDVPPQDLLGMSGAERLHRRFLCGEAPGKMDFRVTSPLAVGDLTLCKHALQETIAEALDGVRDPRDVGRVDAKPENVGHEIDHTAGR